MTEFCEICGAKLPADHAIAICRVCLSRFTAHHNQPMVEVPTVHDRIVQENTGAICDLHAAMLRVIEAIDRMNQDVTQPMAGPGKDQGEFGGLTKDEDAKLQFFICDQRSKLQSVDGQFMATRQFIGDLLRGRGLL